MSKTLKSGIVLLILLCALLLVITLIGVPLQDKADPSPNPTEDQPVSDAGDPDLVPAVEAALSSADDIWAVFDYQVDSIQIQDDGQMALVWLVPVDPETGETIAREPELALAKLDDDGSWQVLLETDSKFSEMFNAFQYSEKNVQGDLFAEADALEKASQVFGGYYLPWAAGLEKRLTWSVAHSSCYADYCYYAFDFADGTMFPLVAAKGGTVYHWKDTCANNTSTCTNSITIQDRSTTPWTYQIYLHIAQGSVPSKLKTVGAPVMQGQYIADVDDTGYSTGHHVHFMVVTENTKYLSGSGYIFGRAVDITFRDVDINWDSATQGGRPRLQYEADIYGGQGRTYYVSGNQPANPPTGGLNAPAAKTYATGTSMAVSGWGKDDVSVRKYEILAKYADAWVTIKEVAGGNSFSTTVNMCETTIPDGPFQLALRVWDYEGNPSGILSARKLIKNVECGTVGSDPKVNLVLDEGVLALPQSGFVSAAVTKGSSGSAISMVEFWFHGQNWSKDNWVYLGKDTNGSNGWQAPIFTSGMVEGSTYTLVAVATDSAGRQGADANFAAIVDHTDPSVTFNPISSPFSGDSVTFQWTGSDALSGVAYYDLGIYWDSGGYQVLESAVSRTVNSYQVSVSPAQILIFEVRAYDKSGNQTVSRKSVYTDGYVFPFGYIMPAFFSGE